MTGAFRVANLLLAAGVAAALSLELVLLTTNQIDAQFTVPTTSVPIGTRLIEMLSFLTTLSNLFAGIVAVLLAIRPERSGRLWRVVRLDALLGIIAIGLAFQILFAPHLHLTGAPLVLTILFHVVNPAVAVLSWLLFEQRRQWNFRDVLKALVWPVVYLAFVFSRGAIVHWYPYALADVNALGSRAYLNGFGVVALFFALGTITFMIDRWVPSLHRKAG